MNWDKFDRESGFLFEVFLLALIMKTDFLEYDFNVYRIFSNK